MAIWPTEPLWTDPTTLNKGNKYIAQDGVTISDMNAIIQNLQYLKVNGSTSEGAAVNGEIKQYKVSPGATVNAGDFVEFVQHWGKDPLTNERPTKLKAVNLTNDTIAVFYIATNAIRVAVATLGESETTVLFNGDVYTRSTHEFTALDVDVINSTNVVVGFAATITSITEDGQETTSYESRCIAVSFDTSYSSVISGTAYGFAQQAIAVSVVYMFDGYIIYSRVTLRTTSSSKYAAEYSACFKVDLSTLQVGSSGITAATGHEIKDASADYFTHIAAKKLDETHVYVAWGEEQYTILTLGNSALLAEHYQGRDGMVKSPITIVKQDAQNFYIVNGTIVRMAYVDGDIIHTTLNSALSYRYTISATIINNILVVLYNYSGDWFIRLLFEDGSIHDTAIDVIVTGNLLPTVSNDTFVSAFSIAGFSTGGLASDGVYAFSFTIGDDGTVTENIDKKGTFVQPATSRLYNVGVAKTGNTGGGVVDVYVVPLPT